MERCSLIRPYRAIDALLILLLLLGLGACTTTRGRAQPGPQGSGDQTPQELEPCAQGRVRSADSQDPCCWPGQRWDQEQDRCVGEPGCPEGWQRRAEDCVQRDAQLLRSRERCAQRDEQACQELWGHPGLRQDEEALAFVQSEVASCREEGPERCQAILSWLLDEQGPHYHPDLALGALEQRCQSGAYEACHQAAQILWSRDAWEQAATSWSAGCQGRHEPSCRHLGQAWEASFVRGDEAEDWPRLTALADQIEEEGWLAEGSDLLLGLYSQACAGSQDQDQEACFRLTLLARDALYQERAPVLWSMACLGPDHHANADWAGDPQACLLLGEASAQGEPTQSVRFLQRACEGFPGTPGGQGITRACQRLVEVNRRLEQEGAPLIAVRQRYGLACDQGVSEACAEAGRLWREGDQGEQGDVQAVRRFQEGCDRGDWAACRQLAWMMERGRGVSLNLPGAADLYERACDAQEMAACFGLAKMVRDGRGVQADPAQARRLMKLACEGGWKPACATP